MLRFSFVLLAALAGAGPAGAASWADRMFDELSKDFGSVPRGPTLTHHFRVTNNTGGPVSIASVRVSCGCVSAMALTNILRPGQETAILARMDTTRFTGSKSVTIYVQFDRPAFEEVRLWVQANGRDDFAVTPDTLAFGQVKRSSTSVANALVTFYGNSDAQITEVKTESNYIMAMVKELRRGPGEVAYQLSTRLRKDAPVGKWYTDVWLKTNNPTMPQVRVPLTVEIESALSVSPEAVTLGQLRVRGESERRVIVRGVKPFRITSVYGTDATLVVHDSTAGARPVHVLTIHFKAVKPGDLVRTVRVVTDLPADNKIDIPVTARITP